MLSTVIAQQLQALVQQATREELIWINGYLSALVSGAEQQQPAVTAAPKKLTVIYGTETGNSKKLALQLAVLAKQHGLVAKVTDASVYRMQDLPREQYLAIIISTHGEGEPPAAAKPFYEALHTYTDKLAALNYAVLALGDSAYPLFCKTGENVAAQLHRLGARPLQELEKCDVDFEAPAALWMERLIQQMQGAAVTPSTAVAATVTAVAAGKKYYTGHIAASVNLNDRGSSKATYHIEIAVPEPVDYEPGDALAVVPQNRAAMVRRILELTGIDAALVVETPKFTAPVTELLTKRLNICYLLASTIKKYAAIVQQDIPDTRMDLVDLLRIYPVASAAQFAEVLKILTPIAPRLYTISSSPLAHGHDIHITVGRKTFYAQDEQRIGLCSEFLGDLPLGTPLEFYIHRNKSFKLPAADKDIIMIGPGTGVAPFRAFLAHRDAAGHNGRNWFFFAEENFTTDFLYQAEMQQYAQTGVLWQTDLAFEKCFSGTATVQERLLQRAVELYNWIEQGAAVYISGDKEPMSKQVEDALLTIIEKQGSHQNGGAKKYLEQLKKEGRYEKDVY